MKKNTLNSQSRIFIYLCVLIAFLPLVVLNAYGFFQELDIYGKIDGLIFCTYFFISLLLLAKLPKALFSGYVFITLFLVFTISKASYEYYLFYGSYISFDHLALFKEFILALKNFSSLWTIIVLIILAIFLVLSHIYVIKSLKKPSIISSVIISIICFLIILPFHDFHADRYRVTQISNQSERLTYDYSFENPVMFFIRSFSWGLPASEYKENAARSTLAKALEKKIITELPDNYLPKHYASLLLSYPNYTAANTILRPLENTPDTVEESTNESNIKPKNVLIVVLESFRSYEFDTNNLIGINLDKIAEKSIVFDKAYSIARATIKSEQAILCSSIDTNLRTPYSVNQGEYAGRCLPQILKDRGYDTTWFHGNTKDFYNRTIFHPTVGFQTLYSKDEIQKIDGNHVKDLGWGIPDPNIYQFALSKLKNKKQPFFAEILTVSSHQPFNWNYGDFKFPDSINSQSDDVYKNYLKALYYADNALGEFWNEFITSPLKDNTIVIFTGDHGVPFYPEQELTEADKFDILFKVPLMIYHPEIEPTHSSFQTSHLDIAPTLMSLLGISVENSFNGRSTLGKNKTTEKRPIFHMNRDGYGFRFGATTCVPRMKQCDNEQFCYKDERFMCNLELKTDILQIQQSGNLMEYMKLLTEARFAS